MTHATEVKQIRRYLGDNPIEDTLNSTALDASTTATNATVSPSMMQVMLPPAPT